MEPGSQPTDREAERGTRRASESWRAYIAVCIALKGEQDVRVRLVVRIVEGDAEVIRLGCLLMCLDVDGQFIVCGLPLWWCCSETEAKRQTSKKGCGLPRHTCLASSSQKRTSSASRQWRSRSPYSITGQNFHRILHIQHLPKACFER